MQVIFIQKEQDLDCLRTLKKKDNIYVKISKEIKTARIPAIDLSQFHGRIEVRFEEPRLKRTFYVYGATEKMNFIFSNAGVGTIYIHQSNCAVQYKKQDCQKFNIHQESDFSDKLPPRVAPGTILNFCNDMAITKPFPMEYSNAIVEGNGHTIYGVKSVLQTWENAPAICNNLSFSTVDTVYQMRDYWNLKSVLHTPNEKVAVSVLRNYTNKFITPANLSDFVGTLIILGQGHKISHVTFEKAPYSSVGLISKISNQANLLVHDLNLSHLSFPEQQYYNVGAFLGDKTPSKTKYPSLPGYTLFSHCSVSQTEFPKAFSAGIFVGRGDDFTEFFNCFSSQNNGIPYYSPLGSDLYFDEQNLSFAQEVEERKRILYGPSRNLTKDKE